MRRLAAAFAILVGAQSASAETLAVALSTQAVEITSNFTGTSLTIFGAVERGDGGLAPTQGYDIAVVVRGPGEPAVTWQKERFLGIFVNRRAQTFDDAPVFYAVVSSRPLETMASDETLAANDLGLAHLRLGDGGGASASERDFRTAFLRLKAAAHLFSEDATKVALRGSSIFQAEVDIPSNVPVGPYTAMVYLFDHGTLISKNSQTFAIAKTGFEEVVTDFARQHALLYGVVCVLMALSAGWLAGLIFRRD